MKEQFFTVEAVVERLGITPRTLHYYEEIGLIRPVSRTEGGHRQYDEAVLQKVRHIMHLKQHLGASLQEIRVILEAEDALEELRESYRRETSDLEKNKILDESIALLETQVRRIDEKLDTLTMMRQAFLTRLEKCKHARSKEDI